MSSPRTPREEMLLGYVEAVMRFFEETAQDEHPLCLEAKFILELDGADGPNDREET